MTEEIERKFLIKGDFRPFVVKEIRITQGYLTTDPKRTVRIRVKDNKGFITIKGMSNKSGISRFEWEKEIPLKEAQKLMDLCESGLIDKIRYIIPIDDGLKFEVDVFYGENEGLIIAEIELPTEETLFTKPVWLGEEVTGDKRYFNSMIMKKPFKNW